MSISCDQANDMLAGFAMNRLDREDEAAMTDHLGGCRLHDIELTEFRAIVGALPVTVDALPPPERMRRSLLQAFEAQAALPGTERAAAGPRRSPLGWLYRTPQLGYGLAAALIIAVIGLTAWNISLSSSDNGLTVKSIEQGGMSLRVVYLKHEKIAVVDVNMPALAANRTYQAWKIDAGGTPVSLGLISERGSFAFHTDLTGVKAIAISVEPLGGSPLPTTTPVLVEEL
jgi:anti-sigma-K factor RskA